MPAPPSSRWVARCGAACGRRRRAGPPARRRGARPSACTVRWAIRRPRRPANTGCVRPVPRSVPSRSASRQRLRVRTPSRCVRQRRRGGAQQGLQPLLAALAAHAHALAGEVQVAEVQADDLREAQAQPVDGLQDQRGRGGPAASTRPARPAGLRPTLGEVARQPALPARRGVRAGPAAAPAGPRRGGGSREAADGRQVAGDGGLAAPAPPQLGRQRWRRFAGGAKRLRQSASAGASGRWPAARARRRRSGRGRGRRRTRSAGCSPSRPPGVGGNCSTRSMVTSPRIYHRPDGADGHGLRRQAGGAGRTRAEWARSAASERAARASLRSCFRRRPRAAVGHRRGAGRSWRSSG